MREALAELVEAAGDNDRRQAAEHHHRQHPAQGHPLLHMHQRGIAHRQRDRPFPHAPGHDRQHDKEEHLKRLHAQQRANADAHQHADHLAAQHWEEDLQEALNQGGAVHTHDAADDNAADIEIEDVGGFIEFGGGFHDHVRQQTVMDQRGRNKSGADRRRAEFPQHRQAFTKLAAGEAKESQSGHHHHDIARQFTAKAIEGNQPPGQQKQRQRDDPYLPVIHDVPPALPERGFRRIDRFKGCRECIVCRAHKFSPVVIIHFQRKGTAASLM